MSYSSSAHIGHVDCEIFQVRTRISLPQLCVISTFCDEISRFPVFSGKSFFRPKVTVGLGNFTRLSRLIVKALQEEVT